ncbi:hypothetical protein [Nakamurella lactea]|uniref:hypothetical protein n=1 Tax=Nakamurella lactea TaxID=459515 RepID=UPI0003F74025|nr:hypothetical protein [Nakamurella lactea]
MTLARAVLRSAVLVTLLAAVPVLLVPAPRALAHPFGPPQTATIEAVGADAVQVRWQFGAKDDISYLAVALKVVSADRVTLDGAVAFEDGDAALVAASPVFHTYLLQHISVNNQGEPCTGTVGPAGALTEEGTTVTFRCPGRLGATAVRIDMLNDLHPAYRTLATGPDGQRAVYDGETTVHDWTLDAAEAGRPTPAGAVTSAGAAPAPASAGGLGTTPSETPVATGVVAAQPPPVAAATDLGHGAAVQLAAVGAGLLVLAAGTLVWRRGRRRRV